MENRMDKTVLLGISGGVDSEYAAALLKKNGYNVVGMYINMLNKSIYSVADVADKLGIQLIVKNAEEAFKNFVVSPFINSYREGKTPNPCVECNRFVKIDYLYNESVKLGIPYIATGHYAKISKANDRFFIKRGVDEKKDQSYFLWKLEMKHLSKLIFPLGDIIKENILPPSESGYKESQDICFIPTDYRDFLREKKVTSPRGFFKDSFGNIVGEHNGIINYTRGQRKGLGVALGYPAYVTNIDVKENVITLGSREELTVHSFKVNNLNFQSVEMFSGEREFYVKTRYRSKLRKANVRIDSQIATVELAEGDDLVTAGQSAVFYDGDNIAFGGEIIEESMK